MPDANGNFKGIRVPRVPRSMDSTLTWRVQITDHADGTLEHRQWRDDSVQVPYAPPLPERSGPLYPPVDNKLPTLTDEPTTEGEWVEQYERWREQRGYVDETPLDTAESVQADQETSGPGWPE